MAERTGRCTYLFTTATITVFSEKLTALIDLNVNRGSLFSRLLEKPMASNQCIFQFFTLRFSEAGRAQWWSSVRWTRPLKECSVQGHSSTCGFPQPVVIKAL